MCPSDKTTIYALESNYAWLPIQMILEKFRMDEQFWLKLWFYLKSIY